MIKYNREDGIPSNHFKLMQVLDFGGGGNPYRDKILYHSNDKNELIEYCEQNKIKLHSGTGWDQYKISPPRQDSPLKNLINGIVDKSKIEYIKVANFIISLGINDRNALDYILYTNTGDKDNLFIFCNKLKDVGMVNISTGTFHNLKVVNI